MERLIPKTQYYEWGKIGEESLVGQCLKEQKRKCLDTIPYAELWFGDHPNGESNIGLGFVKVPLSDWMHINYKKDLPFLFKVLSINKALSIQAHPDKVLAKVLHQKIPIIYKDENHKPELVIAVTPMQILCGFRPYKEICSFLETVPEFAALFDPETIHSFITNKNQKEGLKTSFPLFIRTDSLLIKHQLEKLIKRIINTSLYTSR